jgi:hypothetical protein
MATVAELVWSKRRREAMAELNRQHRDSAPDDRSAYARYAATGRPSVDQLMAEQGTGPIADVSALHGDFWPEEESIEDFLDALHESRGHKRTDPAA